MNAHSRSRQNRVPGLDITSLNALMEALSSPESLAKIMISRERRDRRIARLKARCREMRVPFHMVPQATIDRKAGARNQGVFAQLSPVRFHSLEDLLRLPGSPLILILDGVMNAGNLGAIIRNAAAAGVSGVLVPGRKSAPVNATVLKASSGALLKVRLVQSGNLAQAVRELKRAGFWIICTDPRASAVYFSLDFSLKSAVIIGGEDTGVSSLLKKLSDHRVSIPMAGSMESLNAASASSAILFEAVRQRLGADQ